MMQLLTVLAGTFSYQLPESRPPADTRSFLVVQPGPEARGDSSRRWLRPLFPEDSDESCGALYRQSMPGFGTVRLDFGCVKSKREETPWL